LKNLALAETPSIILPANSDPPEIGCAPRANIDVKPLLAASLVQADSGQHQFQMLNNA
jgi:hypothetical protein